MKSTKLKTSFIFLILVSLGLWTTTAAQLDSSDLQKKWFEHYKKQPNVPDPAKMLINGKKEPALEKGFKALFNGKDIAAWEPIGGDCEFDVVDGAIRGTCKPGSPSTYLYTKKDDYSDFIFTCEMKWEEEGNSGVMFRAGRGKGKKGGISAIGPQMEMEPYSQEREWSGGIYGQGCGGWFYPLWLEEHAEAREAQIEKEWNRITIEARGSSVRTWLNGTPMAFWKTDEFKSGAFGLQVHSGKKGTILWRNLKVKELKKKKKQQ